MKRRLVEWYERNKDKIAYTAIFLILIIIANIVLVSISNNSKEQQRNENTTTNLVEHEIQDEFNQITVDYDESVLTGEDITSGQVEMLDVIEQFAQYCNNQNIEEAYNLLSNECKNEMYRTLNDFKTSYYDPVFGNEKKSVSIENWSSNIFKVTIQRDILSTGIYSDEGTLQDYMSVVLDENENYKLNVNGYLGRKEINITKEQNDIEITVLASNTYKDYQTYTHRITNNSQNQILLDDKSSINSMRIVDDNGIEYSAYTHEISDEELIIPSGQSREIEIKYYNKYISTKRIERIIFSRIILNYNVGQRYNYGSIEIEL